MTENGQYFNINFIHRAYSFMNFVIVRISTYFIINYKKIQKFNMNSQKRAYIYVDRQMC